MYQGEDEFYDGIFYAPYVPLMVIKMSIFDKLFLKFIRFSKTLQIMKDLDLI